MEESVEVKLYMRERLEVRGEKKVEFAVQIQPF